MWYIVAFYFSFAFACAARITGTITGSPPFPLLLLFSIFFPMQGFFNFLVYMRPRFFNEEKQRESRKSSNWKSSNYRSSLHGSRPLSGGRRGDANTDDAVDFALRAS